MVSNEEEMKEHMNMIHDDYLIQEYIDRNKELSVFYIKYPENRTWSIRSIIERKIISKNENTPKLAIPWNKIVITDESYMINPTLEKTFNDISDIQGFYFGRYDIRVKNMQDFIEKWKNFKILEVNIGAQTMALQAYDHKYNILQRYAIFAKQLSITFQIAKENKIKHANEEKNKKSKPIREFLSTYIQIITKL